MNRIMISSIIGLLSAFALLTPLVISHWTMAQIQNTTLPENMNDTRRIFNLKDNTITVINKTTNETISTMPYVRNIGNMTANETLAADTGNMTTNETFSPTTGNMTTNETLSPTTGNMTTNETLAADTGNMTTNELLSGNAGNMTSNEFLAEKFRELGNNSVG